MDFYFYFSLDFVRVYETVVTYYIYKKKKGFFFQEGIMFGR